LKKKKNQKKEREENLAYNQIHCAIKIQRQSVEEEKLVGNVMLAIFHCRLKKKFIISYRRLAPSKSKNL
jgi:hypothetical protein